MTSRKDPIQPYIDGEWVKARGTTLGADNGIGMASALAVLADENVIHGPLEVLLSPHSKKPVWTVLLAYRATGCRLIF